MLKEDQTSTQGVTTSITEGFGAGFSGPLLLISDGPGDDAASCSHDRRGLNADPGIAFATPAASRSVRTARRFPRWHGRVPDDIAARPSDRRSRQPIARRRADSDTGVDVLVGGFTAASIDFADYIAGRLPILIGAVLILSFLLLMVVFRSLLVPLKAVIMNLLSIGAAYGVIVAIFQWGWGKDLFGIGKDGPDRAWVPMMLFAIVFGLSMDYEVFLLSRMKEEFDRTGDNAEAVADGLAVDRQGHHRRRRHHGLRVLGLRARRRPQPEALRPRPGVGGSVDATFVRMVLVPATMELLGDRNWWFPKSLDRRPAEDQRRGSSGPHASRATGPCAGLMRRQSRR